MSIPGKIGQIKYFVVRIDLGDPDDLRSKCLVFRRQAAKLDLDYAMEDGSLESVVAAIPKHENVMTIFAGDQVLTRFSPEMRSTLFEEIEEEEFYLQKTISKGGWMIQSACRKSAIDPILHQIITEKRFLLDVSLSPSAIPVLESLLPDVSIQSDHFRFHFQDGHLSGIMEEYTTPGKDEIYHDIWIEGQKIQKGEVPYLAAIVHHFQEGPAHISLLKRESTQSRFYRRFRMTAMFTLGGFFVLLLTNFLLYSQTSAKLSEMRNSGESNMALVKRIEAIQSEIREYQELRVAGSSSPEETYSFYLEEVAGNRPGGIWFNSLSVHPCTNKKEHGKALLLDYTVLILKGEARDPVSLNSLIGSLESLDWIRDIELVSYENSTEMKNASFELTILKR